ncbi:hypothetical protein HDV00_004555 [Rhizophlyctis rosea]|nr:hypothetical protein HDV00_004555 [Rhizophlyctis rosea]
MPPTEPPSLPALPYFNPTTFDPATAPVVALLAEGHDVPWKTIAILSTTQPDDNNQYTVRYLSVKHICEDYSRWDGGHIIVSGRDMRLSDRFLERVREVMAGEDGTATEEVSDPPKTPTDLDSDGYESDHSDTLWWMKLSKNTYKTILPTTITLSNTTTDLGWIELPQDGRYYLHRLYTGDCPFGNCVNHLVCPGCTRGGFDSDLFAGCGVDVRCPVCMGYEAAKMDSDFWNANYWGGVLSDEHVGDIERCLREWVEDFRRIWPGGGEGEADGDEEVEEGGEEMVVE